MVLLSEMRGGPTSVASRGMSHSLENGNNEGQLGVEYLNDFDLDMIRSGDEHMEFQRRKAAYMQAGLLPSHHQLQNATSVNVSMAAINTTSNGSSGNEEMDQQGHILPHQVIPGNNNGILYSSTNGNHNEDGVSIPNGNARHQLQIVKIMSPSSPPENLSPTHCPPIPSPHDYRNVPFNEAPTPLMDGHSHHHDGQTHSTHRNMPHWMTEGHPMQNGSFPHLSRYDKGRYDPLDLSSVGSESMDDGNGWIRKPEYGGCLVSPQLYMSDSMMHHPMRTGSRNQSSEGRRTPVPNPGGISDEMLLNLAVRDLNKLLHGMDRAEIQRVKQKRRTLKNRGYAQNCRTKRLHQRNALEDENRRLRKDLHRIQELHNSLRTDYANLKERFVQEIAHCKRKYEMPLRRTFPSQNTNNNNNVHNGNPSGVAGSNGPIVQQIPSHLNPKVIEYSEPILPPSSQPIVSSTVKDVRSDGGAVLSSQTPHPDSPEPSNCYWKDER